MTDIPFGFQIPGGAPDPNDPVAMQRFMNQLQGMLGNADGGPVNWELAKQVAIGHLTGQGPLGGMTAVGPVGFALPGASPSPPPAADTPTPPGDPAVTAAERESVAEALRLADLWLEPVCGLPSGVRSTAAWSRSTWLTETLPVWRKLCDPVAARMVGAMGDLVPPEARDQLGPMQSLMTTLGGALFGGQLGAAMGSLAAEVLSAGDIGLPLGPPATAALLPANIRGYGEGLDLPPDEVQLYVALREAAHQRLFENVPWLRAHLLMAVEAYAAGIKIDRDAIEDAMSRIDPADPETMQQLQLEGIFGADDSPAQQQALARLETALALVEGWVSHVVDASAEGRLPNVVKLGETFRRRRAAGGPAEQTFAALVGLELRPRRLREAAAVWAALTEHRGIDGRDSLWGHPDLLPTSDDFADPQTYAKSQLELGDFNDLGDLLGETDDGHQDE